MATMLALLVCMSVLQVLFVKFFAPPFTARMLYGWLAQHWTDEPFIPPISYWRDIESISPHLRRAVLAAEDQRFASHCGFDFVELKIAVKEFYKSGRLRGASTITMQTARTIFLWDGRNLFRKTLEAYYTVLLEIFVDKRRILELYLNTVDWGSDTRGAEAASRKYFNVPSDRLGPEQAALMAAILPRPHKWSPVAPSPYLQTRKDRIVKDMRLMPLL